MRTADNHISALGWVFITVVSTLVAVLVTLAAIVVLVVGNKDQSERNQRHIDCIIALAQPAIPEFCEPVKEQLIDDGIIPADFNRSTTTTTTNP